MASFLSTMTSIGAETVIRFLASGQELLISRAAAGDGIAGGEQNKITELVNPIAVEVNLGEKRFVDSNPSYMLIPVHVSNKGLSEKQYIREIIIYALDEKGREFPFAYSWLEGEDTDNVLPESKRENYDSDTVHIHDVVIIASDQINTAVRIEVSGSSAFVTKQEFMHILAEAVAPSFDNLLAWPGCKRITLPKDESGTYTETIVDKATNATRAKRVTVKNGESDYTENYIFYEEDGQTVKAKYVVHTTKDGTETWTEDVTKGADEV